MSKNFDGFNRETAFQFDFNCVIKRVTHSGHFDNWLRPIAARSFVGEHNGFNYAWFGLISAIRFVSFKGCATN